jgi:hypothetical protein
MNHFSKRLDAIEPAVIATMPLPPDVEAMVHRVAVAYDIDRYEDGAVVLKMGCEQVEEHRR